MTTEIDLGRALIGKSKTASASASSLRHGKTTAASSDGYVSVLLDGSDKPVTLKCSGSYRGGQSVTVANDSGTYSIVNDVTISGSGGGSGSDGEDGATFYPSVDSAGNLSWTNDKGLANPATVNIKGDPGEDGIDGKTPTKGVDYFTASDIKEIVDAVEDQVPIYEHPTGSGYRHIPIGGSNGNILRWSADGAASWGAETIYTHPTCLGDPVTGTPGNQAPAFGGSFDVRFPIFNKDGHATDSIDSKVTIPGNTATESANGLMSKDDKKKLGVIDSLVTAIKAIVDNIDVTYVKKQGDGMSGPLRFGQGGSIYGYDEPDGTGSLEFTASKVRQNGAELATKEYADSKAYTHPTGSGYKHIPSGGSNGNILRWSADGAASWGAETIYTHPTCLGDPVTGTPGNQAPAFGGSFDVRFPIFNKDGHATDSIDSKVTIPGNTATESANGLMSKDDKKKLGVIDSLVTAIKAIVDNIDVTYVKKQGDGMSGPLRFGQGGSIYGYDEPDGTGSLEFTASKVRQNGAELATKEYADSKAYTHPTGSGYKHIPSGGSSGNILRWSSNGTAAWGAETVYTHPVTSGNKHIPSGGASGKILRWASDGTAKWDSETVYTHPSYDGGVDHSPGNQTPSFGGTFTVRFPHVNSQGHTIFAVDNTVTIPGNTATTSAAGLMSAADKSTLGSLNTTVSSIKPIVDNLDVTYVKKSGGAVSGPLSFGHGANIEGSAATNGASVLNLNASQLLQNGAELATKTYVNGKIPTVPTKVSQLQNDSGFITGAAIPVTPRMFTLWTGSESGKISLNGGAQAIDYEFMDIEYTDGTRYMTQRVYAPNGKSVEISRIVSNGSATYIHSSVLTISGNGITQGNQYQTTLTDSGDTLGISTTSPLKVTRVVGWQIT